jgi:hypothetical protein
MGWVRIQKPLVTYDPGRLSVTSSAGLPNFFFNGCILQLQLFLELPYNSIHSRTLHFHLIN